jgi:hypothetical protein
LPGVESVEVSLGKGLAAIKLKPGNTLTPEQLWGTVRKNGFTPKEASVSVRGSVEGGRLKVTGTGTVLDLRPQAAQAGTVLIAQGTLSPPPDAKTPLVLHVRSIARE